VSRLPPLPRDDLDDAGRELFDAVEETRGQGRTAIGADGALVGPFNAWVTAPDVGKPLLELGGVLRFDISIDRRLIEVAIITTGAHWRAEFEWWAHERMAREHGVSDAVIEAIRDGRTPDFDQDDERVVHTVAEQLATSGRIDADAYAQAQRLLGDRGMVELVALCGFYTFVSFSLNAFEVPLPPGAEPVWSG
jgi:4-carboxymuconolactone decarboxylase